MVDETENLYFLQCNSIVYWGVPEGGKRARRFFLGDPLIVIDYDTNRMQAAYLTCAGIFYSRPGQR